LFPLDTETLWASVRKTGRLMIVHEDTLSGGWGAEVAARAADECLYSLEAPIKRVATYDTPLPFAPIMEAAVTPSVGRIVSVARSICA
jgi:pyruvate dehydrogenase E1 component beta subunit